MDIKDIKDIVNSFNTTPFLFVGSGVSRRYLDLPNWEDLLRYFVTRIKTDSLAYSSYENKAKAQNPKEGLLPKVAELVQKDFDEKWFNDPTIRSLDADELAKIQDGMSPFKVELAHYITSISSIKNEYKDEIALLESIAKKSISGVITTNYDTFLEDHLPDFKKYVGQRELIFSSIQGIAEIYKIHGSTDNPNSIIINENDYIEFDSKNSYLAAKLMTIFIEYPIIFIGYSISDADIQKIIRSIISCLDSKQLDRLGKRFIFIEHNQEQMGVEISPYTLLLDNLSLTMTKVQLSDFSLLYRALDGKKSKLPVKLLRRFKQELYNYTLTNIPTSNLRVASLDDTRVGDEEFVMAIGRVSDLGLKGLSGITGNEWYKSIILDDLDFSADELLEHAFPNVIKQNSGKLPVNKYLSEATKSFPDCEELAKKQDFNDIISKSIRASRRCLGNYASVKQIWDNEKSSIERATRLISHLPEENFDVEELESILHEMFRADVYILENIEPNIRTNIRRLIRIYDYLKWGHKNA